MSEEQMKYVANLISQDIEKDKEIEKLNQYIDFYKDLDEKQNKELQNLKQINEEHQRINGELRVDNERLNNIINELEKMMKNDLECAYSMNENGLFNGSIEILEVYLDKLQELKGEKE